METVACPKGSEMTDAVAAARRCQDGRVSPATRLGQNGASMSRSGSNKRQPSRRGPGRTLRPGTGARSIHTVSLLVLVFVDFIVALLMSVSLIGFVLNPDPAVKADPMYVTLALTTGAALLMLVLALNASYLPFMSRQQARDAQLVMFAMAVTGVVTGLLTVGGAANAFVVRLILGSIAFVFILLQNARLAQAGQAAAGRAAQSAPPGQRRSRSRQRRGGRKR
jgi:hypothetical protein